MSTPLLLPEPYATALREAVDDLHQRYAPVGILVSGTIIRGTPHAHSDLDIVAIHEVEWRQRTQRFFNGVPCETFVNPAYRIRDGLVDEAARGRPVLAHMVSTGVIIEDPTGIMAELQAEARANFEAGPQVSGTTLLLQRYEIATAFEDAVDLGPFDQDRANAMLIEATIGAVKWHFLNQGRWLPRPKALLADLEALDPKLGEQVRLAVRATSFDERLAIATPIMEQMVGTTGFFEWDSEPQVIQPRS
jgi:hypothetical protein